MGLILLYGGILAIGAGMLYITNKKGEEKSNIIEDTKVVPIEEIFKPENIYNGFIKQPGQFLLLAKIEGVNFSTMSEGEQNARELAFSEILSRLDYPVRFITNTIIVDTTAEAQRIANIAEHTPPGNLRDYRTMYAGTLRLMREERAVLAEQTLLVIPGKDEDEVQNRFNLLQTSFRGRTGVILNQIHTTDEIYNTIQSILLPEKITKPSDIAADGVTAPIHFSEKEIAFYVEKAIQASEAKHGYPTASA